MRGGLAEIGHEDVARRVSLPARRSQPVPLGLSSIEHAKGFRQQFARLGFKEQQLHGVLIGMVGHLAGDGVQRHGAGGGRDGRLEIFGKEVVDSAMKPLSLQHLPQAVRCDGQSCRIDDAPARKSSR